MYGNFAPTLVASFFIALFVLVMQHLWIYIDEIAGKGVSFFLLIELLFYLSISMIPLALPIGVLIASVMVLGNMAEYYELSSFKSAGVSLWRVMRPLLLFTILIAGFSFLCSNNLIPVSNLKFKSRLYDIRKQKPALTMDEGLFNDDFQGYAIRVGKKASDNRRIEDVIIIDHTDQADGRMLEITAARGEMYATEDQRFFVMQLSDGWQYQELAPAAGTSGGQYRFMRTRFEEWVKVFDLSEFELNRTDEKLFKDNHQMLSTRQLRVAIDSIDFSIDDRLTKLSATTSKYFSFRKKSGEAPADLDEETVREPEDRPATDTIIAEEYQPDQLPESPVAQFRPPLSRPRPGEKTEPDALPGNLEPQTTSSFRVANPYPQLIDLNLSEHTTLLHTFLPHKQVDIASRAKTYARSIHSQAESAHRSNKRKMESRIKHTLELHSKFSLAVACILFLFIGAPMGAIVRKGGFGYPLLIAIAFFMLFMIVTIFSKNLAERFAMHPIQAAWMGNLVLLPLGLLLTWQAMNDYRQLLIWLYLQQAWKRLASKFGKKKPAAATVA
jgi:lipopolysaccharide export system permease protein